MLSIQKIAYLDARHASQRLENDMPQFIEVTYADSSNPQLIAVRRIDTLAKPDDGLGQGVMVDQSYMDLRDLLLWERK